jgi:integrase
MTCDDAQSNDKLMTNDQGGWLPMGFARKRVGKDGKVRYTATYVDLRGSIRSAGTFASEKAANKAWQNAEAELRQGRVGDPARGRQTLRKYVEERWLPNHVLEPTTREKYTYYLGAHILPVLGQMRMADIFPEHIREWITWMQHEGRSAWTVQYCKTSILSSIFTTALNDQVTYIHPCRGVKIPTVPATVRAIITPEQFDVIYAALPDTDAQLLVETAIESGLRWGELAELRVRDLDMATRMLTVRRKVAEVNREFHPDGAHFLVKLYPKDKECRRLKLSEQIAAKLKAHIEARGLGLDGLLFARRAAAPAPPCTVTEPDALGFTEPNAAGRRYRHGTLSAYNAGPCRCAHCRRAFADYRAKRRAAQGVSPRPRRAIGDDEHIGRNWFRRMVWRPACEASGLTDLPRFHDLRHSHASWLLAGGADLQVVKERLGHASIMTTQRYLHTLPEADETAIEAFGRIRNRAHRMPA